MLRFRLFSICCPACDRDLNILPPKSIEAENHGLTMKCPACKHWIVVYCKRIGRSWVLNARTVGSKTATQENSSPDQ